MLEMILTLPFNFRRCASRKIQDLFSQKSYNRIKLLQLFQRGIKIAKCFLSLNHQVSVVTVIEKLSSFYGFYGFRNILAKR